ncbi:MAG TPA: FHA domain-containing protein [Zoogloea sp.]|uniref:FHA domain-containing protein n=1 Tax=Zoogloea sp. TaxID=49181 RepID=UPI002B740B3F|nr:FHA domain-containing protein [Zoogloea sp.]HMV18588.1 FHA domain-containing protein [Rhodocyclaceae bacterium]HMV64538.1 FHA domain-containing protein [Rhodocyclaceae bacterium]HMW53248.1 FHA domain-containing protein [Rhodocyclaceae bacterium]HMY49931.1 FHA domain-containing protein [Rhodocyclaceae bacterium]HMZ76530.1 FHA domain-containing protein [Rhodocyclaceae bacterium]
MPRLILSMDGLVLKEMVLEKERTTIGRKPHNDIQIDNLAISGEHAAIVTILNDAFLEDLNSTNGTYVNGQPVKKHVLQNNDVVELGKYRLKFFTDSTVAAPMDMTDSVAFATDLTRTDASRGAAPAPATEPPPSAAPQPAPAAMGMIQILSGSHAGRTLELSKSLTTLGKPGLQVAVITRRPHGYFITHVEGASFPVVNGRALDPQAQRLNDHDIIEIAGVKMEFFSQPTER